MPWEVILHPEVESFVLGLPDDTYDLVSARIDLLEVNGPQLGRPAVDRITRSNRHNMKELRADTIRILFLFDPNRRAILLVAGDKAGSWNAWYPSAIRLAEDRFTGWLDAQEEKR
ncbi:type II toxin-antitoxin system RelE/ParE family toxin [Promicromonospora sp. Populi]|uniref:type II toxin-antitoxin system RelE/ParE family toxin n=1 Tax=Promicromonospora sp. Populi TaxID=3239420 RepID=UPI0034E2E839